MKSRRSGFSLFEIMIAMAICTVGLVLLLRMLGTSEMFVLRSASKIEQQRLCQNKINEIALGLEGWDEIRREECQANSDFWYSVHSEPHPSLPLRLIEVSVWPKSTSERSQFETSQRVQSGSQSDSEGREFKLSRLILIESHPSSKSSDSHSESANETDGL